MFFSIVVPLYNKSYSVNRCIDSVLAQSFTNYELIIINDGSTDNSLSLIEEKYRVQISLGFLKVINQNNQGVSVARNNGIKVASSSYICFLDADDEWLPEFLKTMKKLITDYPKADLYSLAHLVKKEGSQLFKPKHGLLDGYRGYVEDFFLASSKGDVVNSSKVCVRKESILSFGGFPAGVVAGEDIYVWIRLALKGGVACDMSYLSIVHQEIDNSRNSRKNSIPFPLVYFSKNKEILRPKSLDKYLFVIFYKHFFRSILDLKFKEASIRLRKYTDIYLK